MNNILAEKSSINKTYHTKEAVSLFDDQEETFKAEIITIQNRMIIFKFIHKNHRDL